MGTQRHIDGHAGAHVVAQHFDDFTHRFGAAGWSLGQLDHDHVAHPRAHYLFRRDQDIEAQAAVVRDDKADASVGEVTANYLAGFRHEDADDALRGGPYGPRPAEPAPVAVNTGFHLF